MATEQENLVLNVTLVDNASAGLDKLNQQLKQLGGEQHASAQTKLRTNFAGVQNAIKPLAGDFARLSSTMSGVTKSAMSMAPAIAGVGTAILGVGGILTAALVPIQKFASEMTDLGQLARETGHNAATIKIFREEFSKLFGSSGIQLADTTLRGLQRSMTDILNPASKLRQEMEQGARHTPEMRENMDKLIGRLKEAAQKGDTTEFFNIFEEGMDNIRKNISGMPDRGPIVAATWVADLNKLAGIPEAVAATHVKMKGPTAEAIKNTQMLIDQSTTLTRSFNDMGVSVRKISESIQAIALGPDSAIVKGAQLLAGFMERIAAAADRWSKASIAGASEPKAIDIDTGATIPIPQSGSPQVDIDTGAPISLPQRFSGGGGEDNRKLLEDENKRMAELTAEIKRLSDLLMVPTDKPQGSTFHNTPRGGAKGESNPMQLPAGEKQPGGGAAAEARLDPFTPPPGGTTALAYAKQHLGMHEIANKAKLEKFFRDSNYPLASSAAWCAVYANSVLQQTGHETSSPITGTGAAAGSFLTNPNFKSASFEDVESGYGTYVGILKGKSPRTGQEGVHVGFLTGESRINPKTGKLEYRMRGGNQPVSDENTGERASGEGRAVSDIWYDAEKLHLRRAPSSAAELKTFGIGSDNGDTISGSQGDDFLRGGADEDWHMRATAEAEKLGPSASGRADPSISDDFFKKIPGVRGTVDTFKALGEVERDRESAMERIRQQTRDELKPGFRRGGSDPVEDNLDRKVLDGAMGGEISNHKVEGSADIDINVKRNGGGNDKVSSLFKMPKMERQIQGAPASHGPSEDISGGSNSGIYT